MEEDKKLYSTFWNYTASGVNRIIDKNGYQYIKQREDDWYKIKEGIFLMLIISMASSIEGSLRSFLNVSVNTASSKRQEFINFLSRVDIDQQEDKTKIEKELEYQEKLIRNIPKIKAKSIEGESWSGLKELYDELFENTFEEELNGIEENLLVDIDYLFKFRNFVAHSNLIKFDVTQDRLASGAKQLNEFLKNRGLESKEEVYYVDLFLNEEVVKFFQEKMNLYFTADFLKKDYSLKILVDLIWRER